MNDEFISGLGKLFEEHYFVVPEDRFDLVENLSTEVETSKVALDESLDKNILLASELLESRKATAFVVASTGLADTQVEKFSELVEGLDESLEYDAFVSKIQTLKESYFKSDDDTTIASDDGLPTQTEVAEDTVVLQKGTMTLEQAAAAALTK